MKTGSNFSKQFTPPADHSDWGGISYSMETGKIIRHNGKAGIIVGEPLPTGKIPCWFGNETRREESALFPMQIDLVDLLDLTPDETQGLLALMQALVFRLMDDKKAF